MSLYTDTVGEYRIDELARKAGMTVRNVRAYQDRGLVPGPRRQGRIGLYSDFHLMRLRLIADMLERGYTLANISELLSAWEQGRNVGDLFGFEEELAAPLFEESPLEMSAAELLSYFGGADISAFDPALVNSSGVVTWADDRFVIHSPKVLDAASRLVKEGVPLEAVLRLGTDLREHFEAVAHLFVDLIAEHIFDPMGDLPPVGELPRLAEFLSNVKPLAKVVAEAELLRAIDEAIQEKVGDRIARFPVSPGEKVG